MDVPLRGDARRGRAAVGQAERAWHAAGAEQLTPAAEDDGEDPQSPLVDEARVPQRSQQHAAAVDLQLVARLVLERAHRLDEVALQLYGSRPLESLWAPGGDVLGGAVEPGRQPIARIGHVGPEPGEDVVRTPAEQERVGVLELLDRELSEVVVAVRLGPAAELEAVRRVLGAATWRVARALDDPVEGHERRR